MVGEQAGQPGEIGAPFQIRGNSYTLLTLRVLEPGDHRFFMLLAKTLEQSAGFYRNAPVVLDLGPLAERAPVNLAEFCRRLRQHALVPVGVQNASEAWEKVAVNAGLSVLPPGRPAAGPQPAAEPRPEPKVEAESAVTAPQAAAPAPEAKPTNARLVTEPVRSGQQIYANGGDLIVLAPVGHGAELLADGNIHVYGTLRGRALAGIRGDDTARIFCRALEAELVSIAGVYAVSEHLADQASKNVQIRLDGQRLVIEPLT